MQQTQITNTCSRMIGMMIAVTRDGRRRRPASSLSFHVSWPIRQTLTALASLFIWPYTLCTESQRQAPNSTDSDSIRQACSSGPTLCVQRAGERHLVPQTLTSLCKPVHLALHCTESQRQAPSSTDTDSFRQACSSGQFVCKGDWLNVSKMSFMARLAHSFIPIQSDSKTEDSVTVSVAKIFHTTNLGWPCSHVLHILAQIQPYWLTGRKTPSKLITVMYLKPRRWDRKWETE